MLVLAVLVEVGGDAGAALLTAQMSAPDMHALAARLRGIDDSTFFAALD